MAAEKTKFYPEDELVALVRSLDRPQDKGLFSQDVLLQYPHLAEEYTRVCPKRMDLATAAQRAASGAYNYDARLTALWEDIDLMVNNCHRFNGAKGPLAGIASSFHKFAREQIDAYVANKTGGRRVSLLRLSSAAGEVAHGKRQREETQQRQQHGGNHKNEPGANGGGVSIADVVKLVDSLNRREDKKAFLRDVAEAYPDLREAYEAVCPVKMNLLIAKERAASGYYLGLPQQKQQRPARSRQPSASGGSTPTPTPTPTPPPSVFGDTVAESLVLLRDDVELIVSNCVRFNATVPVWVQRAQSFQLYAHKKIDDFVLRHAPSLKGTRSGVEKYVGIQQEQSASQQGQLSSSYSTQDGAQGVTSPTVMTPSVVKTGTTRPAALFATVVNYVTPTIEPTALQPVFATPVALRDRLISDHLHRETLRARLIQASGEETREGDEEKTNQESEVAPDKDAPCTFPYALSCRTVLSAFATSVRNFYRVQRERHDFADPFEYPRQEEQLYLDCITLIEQQFERLFLHALLYEREKADFYDWSAVRAAREAVARDGPASFAKNTHGVFSPGRRWLDEAHLCYLVRFLQHFPQLMGIACATTAKSAARTAPRAQPALHITQVAKGIIEKLAKITEELLTFISEYEQKVVGVTKKEEEELYHEL